MVIPPVPLLARDRREGLSDGLRQGLQRSCRLRAQARLDLGSTGRERGEGGRRRRQVEGPHASRGTGGGHTCDLMGVAVIQAASLAGMPVRKPSLSQQGQQDGASGAPRDRHGGDQAREAQGPAPRHLAAASDGLCGLCPMASWRPRLATGHRLLAAGCVDQEAIGRGERRDGGWARGPLPVNRRPLLRGGVTGGVCAVGPVW
jgi:hypothetical protein